MPITGPTSYPATMSQFSQHWVDVNAVLGTPVELTGARTENIFTQWITQIEARINGTNSAVIAAVNLKGELDVQKENLISWTVIFNKQMRTDHPTTSWTRNLLNAPQQSAGRGTFIEPLVKTGKVWEDANNGLGVIIELKRRSTQLNGSILTETLTQQQYVQLISQVEQKWNEWSRGIQTADNIREGRNDLMKLAYDTMRDYRAKVGLELPPGHALLDSLPALSPTGSSTPDAPEASGEWNAATSRADLTAVPSTTAAVERHELRFSPDEPYNNENEVVLTSISAGQPLTFSTDIGLAIPGDVSRYTWVAITSDGNEGRSNVVTVIRT